MKAGWWAILGCVAVAIVMATTRLAGAAEWEDLGGFDPPRSQQAPAATLLASAGVSRALQPAPIPRTRAIPLRRLRSHTISLGLQGGYGFARGSSRISDGFGGGPGYAFRFRYMLRPALALGFSFEHHNLLDRNLVNSRPDPDLADSHVVMTTVAGEGVFYFHREREAHPYLVAGFGYASPDIVYTPASDTLVEETRRVNEGAFLVAGAGFERFIRERFSLDLSARGYGLVSNSELTAFLQITAGIHLYPGD